MSSVAQLRFVEHKDRGPMSLVHPPNPPPPAGGGQGGGAAGREGRMPDWLSRLWYEANRCWVMAALSLGFSLRFEGSRHIPRCGPALLVANHQSFIDPLAIGLATPRQLCYLARKTLFKKPLFTAFLLSVGCVPVDQEGFARQGLRATLDLLKQGKLVLVFPEGERTWSGKMQPLKPGVHLLIKRSGAPVVPVGIAGAYEAYPRTKKLPRFSPPFLPATDATMAVSIGRPLDPARFDDWSRERVLDDLFARISEQHQRAERLRRRKPGPCRTG
jgi:1-acyl-sn-glycerol-3-phosphate acyltransferase